MLLNLKITHVFSHISVLHWDFFPKWHKLTWFCRLDRLQMHVYLLILITILQLSSNENMLCQICKSFIFETCMCKEVICVFMTVLPLPQIFHLWHQSDCCDAMQNRVKADRAVSVCRYWIFLPQPVCHSISNHILWVFIITEYPLMSEPIHVVILAQIWPTMYFLWFDKPKMNGGILIINCIPSKCIVSYDSVLNPTQFSP